MSLTFEDVLSFPQEARACFSSQPELYHQFIEAVSRYAAEEYDHVLANKSFTASRAIHHFRSRDRKFPLLLSGDLNTHTHRFNGHFSGKPGIAGCPLDSQSPNILFLSILTGQAKTLYPQGTSVYSARLH